MVAMPSLCRLAELVRGRIEALGEILELIDAQESDEGDRVPEARGKCLLVV